MIHFLRYIQLNTYLSKDSPKNRENCFAHSIIRNAIKKFLFVPIIKV